MYNESPAQYIYQSDFDEFDEFEDEESLLPRTESVTNKQKDDGAKRCDFCRVVAGKIRFYVVDFFRAPPEKYKAVKAVLGFPFGAALGIILYHLVLDFEWLKESTRHFLGGVFVIGLASGYALSVQVRCMSCLLIPTFFGKTGRSYIAAFAVVYLISGPINAIILNGHEVTRSLGCTTELLKNHTIARMELRMKPIGDMMQEFQSEGMLMNKVVKRIEKTFGPMKKEVMDNSEEKEMKKNTAFVDRITGGARGNREKKVEQHTKVKDPKKYEKVEAEYKKKLDYRCEDVWNHAVLACRKSFLSTEHTCLSKIPIVGYLLCLPFKLTVMCELIRLVPGALGSSCNSDDAVDSGFGEVFVAARDMAGSMDNDFHANLQYKVVRTPEALEIVTADEVRQKTLHEFESKQVWLEFGLTLLKRMMAFTFILVFLSAYKYNKAYLTDIKHDNIYITSYFRHIDNRRYRANKMTLLPLKKIEQDNCIIPTSTKVMKAEKGKIVKATVKIVIRALISTVIIFSSDLLYGVLDIIRRNSRIEYRQTGEHIIDIDIYGKGFMSEIVKLFLRGFNHEHKIDNISTNFECLPRPIKMDDKYRWMIYGTFAALWVLMLFEAYGLRLRRLVASGFYRKREKVRVLYMYNDMLKKRRGFLKHMRRHIRKQVRKNNVLVKTSLINSIQKEFPIFCGWLKIFGSGKSSCLICNDKEKEGFYHCPTSGCNVGYCAECWCDIKQRCYSCHPGVFEDSFSDDSDDGFSSSDSSD